MICKPFYTVLQLSLLVLCFLLMTSWEDTPWTNFYALLNFVFCCLLILECSFWFQIWLISAFFLLNDSFLVSVWEKTHRERFYYLIWTGSRNSYFFYYVIVWLLLFCLDLGLKMLLCSGMSFFFNNYNENGSRVQGWNYRHKTREFPFTNVQPVVLQGCFNIRWDASVCYRSRSGL